MRKGPRRLPGAVRGLANAFRAGLLQRLDGNLVSAFLLGSVVFEGYRLKSADIDFFVVTRRPLTAGETRELGRLHRSLARTFPKGDDLDGLYIPLSQARGRRHPRGTAFETSGRPVAGVRDESWALHRAHVYAGAYALLAGADPRDILAAPSWDEVAVELDRELRFIRASMDPYPVYAALNLCRLLYTWTERDPVVSKVSAGAWAAKRLPEAWADLAALASRMYRGKGSRADLPLLRDRLPEFHAFARRRIGEVKAGRRERSRRASRRS